MSIARLIVSSALVLACASGASAQGRSGHPSERVRSHARTSGATAPDSSRPDTEAPVSPRPTVLYADRRFRASIGFRSGFVAFPGVDLGITAAGLSLRTGAMLNDRAALLWDVTFVAGAAPFAEEDQDSDDYETGPTAAVQLSVGPLLRRQVARRYVDFGPTITTTWFALDGLQQSKLAGGARIGAGAFLMRPSGHHARTLGAELRVEGSSGMPSVSLMFHWDAAF